MIPLHRALLATGLTFFPLLVAACSSTKSSGGPAAGASHALSDAASASRGASDAGSAAVTADAGPPLSRDEICARAPVARALGRPGAKPFTDLDARCKEGNYFCDTVDKSPDPKATCFVANDNIARAERESRAAPPGPMSSSQPLAGTTGWDGGRPPKYLDRIDAHLHFTREELEVLKRNRFVVLDRLAYHDYANAFHDVFQEQLPLFVGVDPILHAVFRGTELSLERIEKKRLAPALKSLLQKLRGGLAASSGSMDAETRTDLDTYLGVAAALAAPQTYSNDQKPKKLSVLRDGDDTAIVELVSAATAYDRHLAEVTLFGRPRMIDFSQLTPRGHYAGRPGASMEDSLESYFIAMMWLSRTELNLVSRSSRSSHPGPTPDPSETPREVKDALALSELVERTGATAELRTFEEVYTAFAGRREDVSPAKLAELARAKGIRSSDAEATAKLKAAIGDGFKRTARTHFTVEGAPELPVILTMFGPRIVPDVAPLTRVVHDEISERKWLGAADAAHVLGHDRARAFISDFERFPGLPEAFTRARTELRGGVTGTKDIYGSWLRSILALADKPSGVAPSFTKTDAYADHRLNSALVGYGQLRHTFVLLAAQGYDSYGCEIPDAYVEPLPAVFDALLAHVRNMRGQVKGWEGLERVVAMLATIARDETNGRALTEPQKRWLGMVSEHIANGGYVSTGEPPKWTGWYFDMFEDREHGATSDTAFIADYFTLSNARQVAYLGAEGPRLGVYIVDTNGEPRAMVGPVAKGFEAHAPIEGRLDDAKVFEPSTAKQDVWRASFAVPERADPPLGLEGEIVRCGEEISQAPSWEIARPLDADAAGPTKPVVPSEWRVAVRSTRTSAGPTSITLLDHHGDPITSKLVIDVGPEWKVGLFELSPEVVKARYGVEAVHVRVDDLARSRSGTGSFDYTTSPSVFSGKDYSASEKMPARPRGPGFFTVGAVRARCAACTWRRRLRRWPPTRRRRTGTTSDRDAPGRRHSPRPSDRASRSGILDRARRPSRARA